MTNSVRVDPSLSVGMPNTSYVAVITSHGSYKCIGNDWPDVEGDGNERVEDDDVREERHDSDDGRTCRRPRLVAVIARHAARYETFPR